MTLPELAIRRPITILVLLVSIFVVGTIAVSRLPLAFMPEVEDPNLFVIVDYPNASPKAVERLLIRPLEEALSSISGLKRMWSRCDGNGGRVNLFFDFSTDIDMARIEIRERLDRIQSELPEDVERITISSNWNPRVSGEAIMEGRISSGLDLSRNYELLDRKIIKPLERIAGVAAVDLDGVNPREIKINLKMNALKRHHIEARAINRMLVQNHADRSLGVIRDDERRITLRAVGSFQSLEQIRNLPVPGTRLKLSDIAEVTYKEPPLEYGRHLDGQFAVGVSISQESNANTVEVSRAIRERVKKIGEDPDLEGINFLVWEDQGEEITKTIGDLIQTGILGGLLASIILFVFLRRLSTTMIAVTCIPFSLIVACAVVWTQGKTLNTVTLLGLIVGIGMLVDNAVVVMENIDRYQQKGYANKIAALLGAREVSVAVIAATLTSIIVFIPMIFSKPSEDNLILRELALTVIFTLLASLFISQTLIPLASSTLLRSQGPRQQSRIMNWLRAKYSNLLAFTLRHGWVSPVIFLLVIGTGYYPFTKIDKNFESNDSEMFVGMRYFFSEDLPLEKKEVIVSLVEEALKPHQERLNVKSSYSWWSDRASITRLYMEPGFANEAHMSQVKKELPDLLPKIPGVRITVQDNGRFWQRNRGKRIGFQLHGTDTDVLSEWAEKAKLALEQVPGLFDFYTTDEGGISELHTRVDLRRMREYQIDPTAPAETVSLTFRGNRLPRFKSPDGEIEMRITLDEQEAESIDQLKDLPILLDNGNTVPLESFSQFAVVKGPDSIQRDNRKTSMWIGARYDEGKKEDYFNAAKLILEDMNLPYGYNWDFQSVFSGQQESQKEFLINLLLALGLIFAVMAGLFESIRQAVSLMISLPLAAAGAFWALYLTGTDLDQPAAVGLLLLLGIVVNNGIVMIEHINSYRRAGMTRAQAMIQGGRERLRPILITALTTLFGLVPMVVQQPSLGGVYYYSMAYVIMGGLLVSTVLTSILLPTTVCLTEDLLAWAAKKLAFLRKGTAVGNQTSVEV